MNEIKHLDNTCPNCGASAPHYLTDISGREFYKCSTALTTFHISKEEGLVRSNHFRLCDTVILNGRKFNGHIAFYQINEKDEQFDKDGNQIVKTIFEGGGA